MAENTEKQDETAAAPAPKKGSIVKILIIVFAGVFVLGAGGFLGWHFLLNAKETDTELPEKAEKTEKEEEHIIFPIKTFIVNLMDSRGIGKKYLKVTMELEVADAEGKARVERYSPQLRDTILLLLTSQSLSEINTLEGKLELKQALLTRMNRLMGKETVHRLYFTEFVVQ